MEAVAFKFVDSIYHRFLVIEEGAFRKLDLYKLVRAARIIDHISYLLGKVAFDEMRSGNVYGNRYAFKSRIQPSFLVCGHMPDHVMIYLDYKSVLLKDGDELSGGDKAQIRRLPSYQSFGAFKRIGPGVVFGLVIYQEFLILQSFFLSLLNLLEPFLLGYYLLVKVSDAGFTAIRESLTRRAGVIIFAFKIDIFPLYGITVPVG